MEPDDDPVAEAAKLPLPERVTHKNWKVREAAYRELTDKFNVAPEDGKVYPEFSSSLSKIVRDANAAAQQVGFDCAAKFAEMAPPPLVRRVAHDIGKGLAEKGMNGRPTNKQHASAALLMFVGADCGDIVIDVFSAAGFKSKAPKVVQATADTIREALDVYGSSAMPVKVIASHIPFLLGHSNDHVRTSGKALAVELHRWVGNAAKAVLQGAREVTVKEIEALFAENAQKPKPKPKKLTRSKEQRVRASANAGSDEDSDDGFGQGEAEEEELDLAEEIDLPEKLEKVKIEIDEGEFKGWYTALDSKKWSARKEALDTATDIVGELRLTPGPHTEIFSRLRKVLAKDSNVNVVASAAKLIRSMASGLRRNFPPPAAKALTVDLMGRLKEKNKIVIDAVASALLMLHSKKCVRVVELRDEITAAAGKKSPKARVELLRWLAKCLIKGIAPADMKGAPLKSFGSLLVTATDDSTSEVRDAAIYGIAALQVLVGDRNVAQFLEKLDKKRLDKVTSCVSQIVAAKKDESPNAAEIERSPAVTTRSAAAKKKSKKSASDSTPSAAPSVAQDVQELPLASDDEGESGVNFDTALESAAERYPGFDPEAWGTKSAKARAASVKSLRELASEKESLDATDVDVLLSSLARDPGLNDSSFMVVKEKLELLGTIAEKCKSPIPRRTLRLVLEIAAEKLGDIKCATVASNALMLIAESTSPRYLFDILSKVAQATANGRAQVGILKLATKLVDDFGIPAIKPEAVASLVVGISSVAAPAVQKASTTLSCYTSVRADQSTPFREILVSNGLSGSALESFDAEISKYQNAPDPPTRQKRVFGKLNVEISVKAVSVASVQDSSEYSARETPQEPVTSAAGSPASEVKDREESPAKTEQASEPIEPVPISVAKEFEPGSKILKDLRSSSWRARQDALNEVDAIIAKAQGCIKPNVGIEIVPTLKSRLSDSNRNVAAVAYSVTGRLIQAMGSGAVVHLKIVIPTILGQGCVDIKKNVRDAAMQSLDQWFSTVGLAPLIPYLHLPLASLNSSFRRDFLEWLAPRLLGEVGTFCARDEDLTPLLDSCLACLRDRTVEVRQLADVVMQPVLESVGFAAVEQKLSSMTKSARLQLEPILERHRSSIEASMQEQLNEDLNNDPNGVHSLQTPSRLSVKQSEPPLSAGRFGRERPRSIAVPSPRTPAGRRFGIGIDEEGKGSTGRRPRPASARVGSSPFASPMHSRHSSQVLRPNDMLASRAARYMAVRNHMAAEIAAEEGIDGVLPYIAENADELAADLRQCVSPVLYTKLTAPANRFQLHIEAMNLIRGTMSDNPEGFVSIADVILRWAACRIEDNRTPPTVLSKIAEFICSVCEVLLSSGVKLTEYEASALIPPIIEKCGSNRDSVRKSILACLLSIGDVVPEDVMLTFLAGSLRRPIGERACEEVAAEICELIDRKCSGSGGLPAGVLPVLASVASGADDSTGRAAAHCLSRAHNHFGDDLWPLLGTLTEDNARMLEERLAYASSVQPDAANGGGDAGFHQMDNTQGSDGFGASTPRDGTYPSDIRTSDFRLSVAPEPPSSVLSSIKEVLSSSTPAKTRRVPMESAVPSTPALPRERRKLPPAALPQTKDICAHILNKITSPDRSSQHDGIRDLYLDLEMPDSKLRERPSEVLPVLSRCFSDALERLETRTASEDDPLILKRFLNAIMAFAREPDVIRRVDQPGMQSLLSDLLNAMVPETVPRVGDWTQVRRGVNLVTLKVLEACDQNLLFTSLINVLGESLKKVTGGSEEERKRMSSKCSFCIKSLAKAAQTGYADCNIEALLRDIDAFLTANPVRPQGEKISEEQTIAIRLLKTMVDSAIAEFGASIRKSLELIPDQSTSQLVRYIDMKLEEQDRERRADHANMGAEDSFNEQDDGSSASNNRVGISGRMDESAVSARYGSNVNSAGGRYGRPPLPGDAADFRLNSGVNYVSDHAQSLPKSGLQGSGQIYMERLHEIQMRYGLHSLGNASGDQGSSSISERGVQREKENGSSAEQKSSIEETRGKASALRERMARIRAGRGP